MAQFAKINSVKKLLNPSCKNKFLWKTFDSFGKKIFLTKKVFFIFFNKLQYLVSLLAFQ